MNMKNTLFEKAMLMEISAYYYEAPGLVPICSIGISGIISVALVIPLFSTVSLYFEAFSETRDLVEYRYLEAIWLFH